jgi:transposase
VQRAKIILGLTVGETKKEIAQQLGIVRQTVRRWEQRFLQHGAEGLDDAPRSGRPPVLQPEKIAQIVYKTTQETPSDSTHWSTRSLAQEVQVSASSVGRIWRAHDLKPHRVRTFKLSNDRYFAEKTDDVVQLYLNPPPHSIVWSADEQCQIQALSRTQPGLTCAAGTIVRPRPTIISATERLLCSPRWMCSEARSCTCFGRNTVIRNGSNS